MRKLGILISLALLVFIGNFGLWFWNTHLIKEALNQFKKELAYNNIQLSYSDIFFSNFKSWKPTGRIENLDISYGYANKKHLHIENLNFSVKPFKDKVKFFTNEKIFLNTQEGDQINSYEIALNDYKNTKIEIIFDSSIGSIIDILRDPESQKLGLLKELKYKDSGIKIRDSKLNSEYLSSSDNSFSLEVKSSEESKRLDMNVKLNKILLNPNYDQAKPNPLYMLHARNGNISVGIDFSFEEKPSQLQYEMLKNPEFKKKGLKLVLDSYELNIKDMYFDTDLFQSSVSGIVIKEPTVVIPNANLDMKIKQYKEMINYHIALYNINVDEILTEHPFIPLSRVQPDKKDSFIALFKDIGNNSGDDLDIKIQKETGGDIMIGKKNAMLFFSDLQQLLEKPSAKKSR